jgi:hypothetical protein
MILSPHDIIFFSIVYFDEYRKEKKENKKFYEKCFVERKWEVERSSFSLEKTMKNLELMMRN